MSVQYGDSTPGLRSERTFTPREILWSEQGAVYLPGGKVIDGSVARDPLNTGDLSTLRPGLVVGKITSGGKYAPSILGVTVANFTATTFTMSVTAATATELTRRIGSTGTFKVTGPPTSAGTVATSSVSYTAISAAGAITVLTTLPAFYAGALIRPNDGSETPLALLSDHVRVTDVDGNNIDARGSRLLVSGCVVASQIINYPADASLKTWLKDALNTGSDGSGAGPFLFDDNF